MDCGINTNFITIVHYFPTKIIYCELSLVVVFLLFSVNSHTA